MVGSIADRALRARCVAGVDAVVHSATLHKPHVDSHDRAEFVATNITGTLNLLEEAVAAGAEPVHLHSTTSAFGRALAPAEGEPAAWITEDVPPVPRNIYGATKTAAEDLCELVAQDHGLPCLILRTSRFFPELDDRDDVRTAYDDLNLKVNELLHRRVDLEDIVERPPARAGQGAGDRIRPLRDQRRRRRSRADDCRGPRGSSAPSSGGCFPEYEEIYADSRLADVPVDRAHLRQRAGAPRARLVAAVGLPPTRSSASPPARSRAARSRRTIGAKGYHAELDRRLHRPLNLGHRAGHAGGAVADARYAVRIASAARAAVSSSRACTSASGRSPGPTRSPIAAT